MCRNFLEPNRHLALEMVSDVRDFDVRDPDIRDSYVRDFYVRNDLIRLK